jgi:hypothetical protein
MDKQGSMNDRVARMPILRTQSSESALLGSGRRETLLEPLSIRDRLDRGRDGSRSQGEDESLSSQLKSGVVQVRGLRRGRCGRHGRNGRSRGHEEGKEEGQREA